MLHAMRNLQEDDSVLDEDDDSANFLVYYEVDGNEYPHVLTADWYDSSLTATVGSWHVIECIAD